MSSARRLRRAMPRRAFSLPDLFWLLFLLILLIAILLPSLVRARQLAKRAVCMANLRGIGQALYIYANENVEWFPHHYYDATHDAALRPPSHGVTWVGTMGSNDFLRITEPTGKTKSPKRSHPSRALFMLVTQGTAVPTMFVCPSSGDQADDLRNRSSEGEVAAQPGVTRFDFRGYGYLSYGYQMPYGEQAKPHAGLDPRVAIGADKGPYYKSGGEGVAASGTVRDARSGAEPPAEWGSRSVDEILRIGSAEWRRYNSRNHKGEGQNVLFVDGHVPFEKRPLSGVDYDNIYTLQTDFEHRAALIGMVPRADQPLGPLTNTDSFIVP